MRLLKNILIVALVTATPNLFAIEQTPSIKLRNHDGKPRKKRRLSFFSTTHASMSLRPNANEDYGTMLFRAIADGDEQFIRALYRPNIVVYAKDGATPLYLAAKLGNYELVKFFLSHNEDPNQCNRQPFITRTRGKQVKTRDSLDKRRESLCKQLSEVGGVSFASLSPECLRRLSPRHSQAIKSPRTNVRSEIRRPLENIIEQGGICGDIEIPGETPLYALAYKTKITADDLAIAELLLAKQALCHGSNKSTPLSILEERLTKLAESASISTRRDATKAKRIFYAALASEPTSELVIKHVLPIWYLYADSNVTAQLIEHHRMTNPRLDNDEKGYPHRDDKSIYGPFSAQLVTWELDGKLPSAYDARSIFDRVKPILSQNAQFMMLLRYFYLREIQERQIAQNQREEPISVDIYKLTPQEIAEVIAFVHRKKILALDPRDILRKHTREAESPRLVSLENQIHSLQDFVAFEVVKQPEHMKIWEFWHNVGLELYKRADLLGAMNIRAGLRSQAVSQYVNNPVVAIAELENYKTYVTIKNEILKKRKKNSTNQKMKKSGYVIPGLVQEQTLFIKEFERADFNDLLLNPAETTVPLVVATFMNDFLEMQKVLRVVHDEHVQKARRNPNYPPAKNLVRIFSHLPSGKSAAAAQLISEVQRAAKKEPTSRQFSTAELWDTVGLAEFIVGEELCKQVDPLVQRRITTGAQLVEYVLLFRAERFRETTETAEVVTRYLALCSENKIDPLGKLNMKRQFQVDLFKERHLAFPWIMWLRNNQFGSNELVTLSRMKIDNFQIFIDAPKGFLDTESFDALSAEHKEKLEHLRETYEASNDIPEDILQWKDIHVHAWLFEHGLSHLTMTMETDRALQIDHFLSYLYLLQRFKMKFFNTLRLDKTWVHLIASTDFRTLFQDFDERAKEILALSPRKRDRANRLYFVRLFVAIDAAEFLQRLYQQKIYTLKRLENAIAQEIENCFKHKEANQACTKKAALLKYGVSDEHAEQLLSKLKR